MRNPGRENLWKSDQFPERFGSFAPHEETVVEWADSLPAGARVLDIGRGVGRHVVYLGQRGLRLAGCDISLSGMRRAYAACVYRQVPFDGRVCSMSALPWPDAFFDAALSTSTIHLGLRSEIQQALAGAQARGHLAGRFFVRGYLVLPKPARSGQER